MSLQNLLRIFKVLLPFSGRFNALSAGQGLRLLRLRTRVSVSVCVDGLAWTCVGMDVCQGYRNNKQKR